MYSGTFTSISKFLKNFFILNKQCFALEAFNYECAHINVSMCVCT